jgi:two-component system LytT family response regulator
MEKIRTLIIDDELLAREGVQRRLRKEPDIEIIGECGNGHEAVDAILRDAPDLVFLDIQMPLLDGFGVIEAVGATNMPQVIFVTAYDEHALRAFDVHALDYLLKPIDAPRFVEALKRARARVQGRNLEAISEQLQSLIESLRAEKRFLNRLSIKTVQRIIFLSVDEIDWIEAAGNYVQVHAGRATYLLHATMNHLEEKLDSEKFLRIHRSAIVNLKQIKEVRPLFHGEYLVLLRGGAELTSGRSYKDKLQQLLDNS